MDKTFEEIAADKVSTVYADFVEDGIRCKVMRGPCALVAYLGIPPRHPMAGKDYNGIPLSVHGGLTFGEPGWGKAGDRWPAGYYWYGWDYGHCNDKSFYDIGNERLYHSDSHEWTVKEVIMETKMAAWDMRKMLDLYVSPWQKLLRWLKTKIKPL